MRLPRIAVAAILVVASGALQAAPQSEVLSIDLAPLIDQSASDPGRFAVEIPHAVDLSTLGEWSTVGTRSVWRYTMQIPTAVSMSFHATPVYFPGSARLRVTAGGEVYSYSAKDVNRGQLWSRIARGDTLALEISVTSTDLRLLRFTITAFQAGYRGLGHSVPNHPHYDRLQGGASGTQTSGTCEENWACHTDSVNSGGGQGTAALVIGNVGLCTGVLLNDVPGDGTPYMLTARHCENGDSNGGLPSAAASIAVYWDAVVACGMPLGTIYDPGSVVQYGATTVVEQQDAWLVRLDGPPVANDAYYAGWDATGAAFIGGFTPHHALGTSRQFIGWYGQAYYDLVPGSALGVGFNSTLWALVNAVGSSGGGASGSGLFDENGRLTGTIIRGVEQPGGGEAGICPVASPSAPSAQSNSSLATALYGIFSSTDDPKSTTGSVTIQSVLDPGHSGKLVVDGQAIPPTVSFSASASSQQTGNFVFLQWTSSHATSCTASGGESGDGWAGALATSGNATVTSLDGGTVTYTLSCANGSQTVTAQAQVNWTLSTPVAQLTGVNIEPAYGTAFQISWSANVRPCTASGGTPGDGWSGAKTPSGTTAVTESTIGNVTYTLNCGAGSRTVTAQVTVTVLAPVTSVTANAVNLLPGQQVQITASTRGLPCVASGGSATDGWSTNTQFNNNSIVLTETESVPGTYTYTVTCGSGAQLATSQATVVFANGAPSVSLASSASSAASNSNVTLSWDANVGPCTLGASGPQPLSGFAVSPHDSRQVGELVLGSYLYTVACGTGANTASASTTVTYTGTPRLSIFPGPSLAIAGQIFLVQYQSNLAPCVLSGGTAGDGWSGTVQLPNANINVQEPAAGSYTYSITCGTAPQSLSGQTTVAVAAAAPMVTVSSDKSFAGVNQPVTISWNSNVSPCQASGGVAGDGWGGALATSGSQTLTETTTNLDLYRVACGVSLLSASSYVSVNWLPYGPPTLQALPTAAQVGQTVTLTWSSMDGSDCEFSGGTANDGWAGSGGPSGSFALRESSPGTYFYYVSCGSAPQSHVAISFASAPSVPLPPPPASVQLGANITTATTGAAVMLTWTTANVDSCVASGGSSADGWMGTVSATGGSQTVTEANAGTYKYSITCSTTGQAMNVASSATVEVNAAPMVTVTASPGGAGKSGGGGLTWLEIMTLGAALAMRAFRGQPRFTIADRRWGGKLDPVV